MTPRHVSLMLIGICLLAIWQVTVIPESAIPMAVGPQWMPAVIVALLTLCCLAYGLSAFRGRQVDESRHDDQAPLPGSGRRMIFFWAGGVAFMVGVGPLGFWAPATLCGMCIARSFDAPFHGKSLLICGVIAAGFWLVFAHVLGVGLGPATPWGF
jgi:hypothetical protein